MLFNNRSSRCDPDTRPQHSGRMKTNNTPGPGSGSPTKPPPTPLRREGKGGEGEGRGRGREGKQKNTLGRSGNGDEASGPIRTRNRRV